MCTLIVKFLDEKDSHSSGPEVIKKIMLSSAEHEIYPAHKCQGSHRLEKYLNFEGFLDKSLKIKSAWKSIGKSLKSFEKSLYPTIFCRT